MKDVLHEAMDLEGLQRVLRGISDGAHPLPGRGHAGAVAVLARDSERQSVRVSRRRAARRAPRARRRDAPRAAGSGAAGGRTRSIPRRSPQVRAGCLAGCARRRRTARRAANAGRAAGSVDRSWRRASSCEALADRRASDLRHCFERWHDRERSRRGALARASATVALLGRGRASASVSRRSFPDAQFEQRPAAMSASGVAFARRRAARAWSRGWMQHIGPDDGRGAGALRSALPLREIEQALLRLEASGAILRGQFRPDGDDPRARRRMVRPAPAGAHSPADARARCASRSSRSRRRNSCAGCCAGSTSRPARKLAGERGTLEVLRQLQGFEVPANAWERQILARRVADYDPEDARSALPHRRGRLGPPLAASGHARRTHARAARRRVVPTSVAPITFFVREDADWMTPRRAEATSSRKLRGLSHGGARSAATSCSSAARRSSPTSCAAPAS